MKRKLCVVLGFAVIAVRALASAAPTNSVPENDVTGKIESSSASVRCGRGTGPSPIDMQASCTFSIKTMATREKQPILKLIICHELGNGVRYYVERYSAQHDQKWLWTGNCENGIEEASKLQTMVESSLLRRVTVKSEYLNILYPSVGKGSKVLAVRTELWLDGNMLCNHNPQNIFALLKLGLPEDWYVKSKYPDKIKYRE